jgi:subtilisin family serine protease
MRSLPAVLLTLAALAAVALAQPPGILPGEQVPVRIMPGPQPGLVLDDLHGILPGEEVPTQVLTAQEAGEQTDWGVERLGASKVWARATGKGVRVAVLDTGCDLTHPDLAKGIVASKDFTGSRSGPSDVNGHGSHCCGTIGARKDGQGLIGVAPDCSLIVVKVLSDAGSGSDVGIAAGIDWATEQGADVISMSLGAAQPSGTIHEAVKRAVAKGVIVVAAAGNSGPGENTVGYPGAFAECVAVAASDDNDGIARFSSRGPQVYVTAPGVLIRSCYPGGRYAEMSGTSMATPHVAGAAALWVQASPAVAKAARPAAFRAAVKVASKDLLIQGRDTASGWGLLDADKLVPAGGMPPQPGTPLVVTEDDLTPAKRAEWDARFPGGKLRLEFPGVVPGTNPMRMP